MSRRFTAKVADYREEGGTRATFGPLRGQDLSFLRETIAAFAAIVVNGRAAVEQPR